MFHIRLLLFVICYGQCELKINKSSQLIRLLFGALMSDAVNNLCHFFSLKTIIITFRKLLECSGAQLRRSREHNVAQRRRAFWDSDDNE